MFRKNTPWPPVVLQVLPAMKEGGVEKSALEMAIFLAKTGRKSLVASAGGPNTHLLALGGASHITMPLASKNPFTMLGNVLRLRSLILRENVSIVHARSRAPAWSAWAAARLCGVPFICTFHGTYGLKGGELKQFYNSVMLRSPFVIANSHFIKHHIETEYHYPADRILVAPRGIEPADWTPSTFTKADIKKVRDELDVPKGVPLLLMVGRISSWKGHALLLRALALIPPTQPWVMALAGATSKNPYADKMIDLAAQLGLADKVRFLGTRNDTPRLLAASALAFSCSTRPEAFGRVAIEAMAMGVPVIATALGGSLETLIDGKTGWLVPHEPDMPDSFEGFRPQALAKKIEEALRNPSQLATMGQTARKHVLANSTVEQCCTAELQAYQKLTPAKNKG